MWQDIAIAAFTIVIDLALIPQIIHGFKTKRKNITFSTGLLYIISTFALSFIYFTLNLYLSTIVQSIGAIEWLTLFIQSIVYKK